MILIKQKRSNMNIFLQKFVILCLFEIIVRICKKSSTSTNTKISWFVLTSAPIFHRKSSFKWFRKFLTVNVLIFQIFKWYLAFEAIRVSKDVALDVCCSIPSKKWEVLMHFVVIISSLFYYDENHTVVIVSHLKHFLGLIN